MKKAFTLIELLVVIAIIAILAAILFPVFAQAKAAAKKTSSLSNVKNIALAGQIYGSDADDYMPPSIYTINNADGSYNHDVYWPTLIYPYIKNGSKNGSTETLYGKDEVSTGGIYQSPGDTSKQINGSYIPNWRLWADVRDYGTGTPSFPARSATAIDDLANKIQMVERGVGTGKAAWFGFPGDQWFWVNGGGSVSPNSSNQPTSITSRTDLTKNIGDCDNALNPATNGFTWQNCAMYPRYRYNSSTVGSFLDGHAGTFARTTNGSKLDWFKNIYVPGVDANLY